MSDVLTYDVSASVATITLNRPDAMNALTTDLKDALRATLEQARDDSAVRAVVLTGAGRAFCSGQDLREHAAALEQLGGESLRGTIESHYNPITVLLATMPKPVIAAVNGMAAGAGASFAFACDFRLAADTASFLMAFTRVGLTADSGSSWTLQRLIGYGRATALLLLAEPVSAEQALAMGLVNAVVSADRLADASRELAERLAAGPTLAYAETKAALGHAASSDLPSALAFELDAQVRCGSTDDHRVATAAFLAKERPTFTGR